MGFVVVEGVGVSDHASRRVVPGDGQGVTQVGGKHLWESRRHAAGDDVDAADGEGLYAVQRGHGEGAALGQRAAARSGAIAQGFFVQRDFPAVHFQAIDHHRVVVVVDVQHQIRGARIAVLVGEGVGEGLGGVRGQRFEGGIVGVEGVGVSTVRPQNQGAVGAGECTASNGAGRWAGGHAVGALDVVVQHVAGEAGEGFSRSLGVAVVFGRWHIVDDIHIQRVGGRGAVAVHQGHGKAFAQVVGACTRCMGFVVVEGVGVSDHACSRVIPGDGQGITQVGGKHLWESGRHTAGHHVDAADGEGLYAVQCGHGEGAALGQRAAARSGAIAQGFFVQRDFPAVHFQAIDYHRVIVVVDVEH